MDISICFLLQLLQVVFQILCICGFWVIVQGFFQIFSLIIFKSVVNIIFVICLGLSSIEWIYLICNIFKFRYNFWKGVVVDVDAILNLLGIVSNHLESLIELELNLLSFWWAHKLFVIGCKVLEFCWIHPILSILNNFLTLWCFSSSFKSSLDLSESVFKNILFPWIWCNCNKLRLITDHRWGCSKKASEQNCLLHLFFILIIIIYFSNFYIS